MEERLSAYRPSGLSRNSLRLLGLAIAALAGVVLNAILPGNDYEFGKSVEGDASADLGSY